MFLFEKGRKVIAFSRCIWNFPILFCINVNITAVMMFNVGTYVSNSGYRIIFKIVQIFLSWERLLIMWRQDKTVNFYQPRSHKSPFVCSLHFTIIVYIWSRLILVTVAARSNLERMHFPYWAEESRALEHIVGRHVTVSQLLSNRGSMSTTELSWGQSAKAAGPPIWGRGLGALAGQALFTPAAGPGVFAASITLPPGRQGENFCTSQNRICPQKVSRLRFVHCIQELVARKVCWFDGNRFVCVSCNQVGYRALTTARAVHLYASGQLRPWPYYTLSAADTPLQPAPTRQGTSSTKTWNRHVWPNFGRPYAGYLWKLIAVLDCQEKQWAELRQNWSHNT